jgi:predicted nucleic acid-binding protein
MAKYLLDSTVLINYFRGLVDGTQILKDKTAFIVSFVTVGELLQGVQSKNELARIQKLFSQYKIHLGSAAINQLALKLIEDYRFTSGLHLLDAIQASIALSASMILVTDNTKHFRYITDLKVRAPAEIM